MTAAVSLHQVQKSFNNAAPVVNDLSFDIQAGEMFGLLGPNGAGKSTTIRMITTLTQPTGGLIQVAGYDAVKQKSSVKQRIGVVLQQTSIDGDMSVWENMEFHGRLHHIPTKQRQERIDRWLDYVELTEKRDDKAKTLSGGMKRRLQIARALLHEPGILFLDEPTVGLDPQTRRRLWEIIRNLNKTEGLTMLLTTHYMDEVEYLCDRIGIMDKGKLIELGTLAELRQNHGEGLVVKQKSDAKNGQAEQWDYKFFPTLDQANQFLDTQSEKTGMMTRPSNLEDIFVELTGRNLD
ncbi:ABC transporter ATP-binding protein [filamentous cyanobacterium LEGE 11480]|uniref:ABC transporter ATP-binding protein n=1 Tax=Romeriopsis navalis LEGE 11480 TaxID=2777977 RepID=A0A928VIZ4_9CYAN|nr:ABC transporter ATP-binding protein [Romeriopsis navalis]MBE9029488.1 ABC transporter ATP-binding protein [Romeriopsis navalis LEGE 11480]